ncbi:unnamed protein product [Moneuplotes crassus]|uniref:Tubulin--tyrosine ligase-like protein 9 n=2 Tax=Euplotes crassus TaxID=5936 RepID=A0AAD1UFU7_EUPCR|nr:unnamed protein product [Moneuplotes crassus]
MNDLLIPTIDTHDHSCTICISKAESEENLGKMMEEYYDNYKTSQDFEGSDILWLYGEEMGEYDREMFHDFKGFINKIYGTMIFKHKDLQYTVMNQCKKYHADKYGFHPASYTLMKEFDLMQEDIRASGRAKSWIAKPSEGLEGSDIFCFDTFEELMARGVQDGMVAQQYIHNPLLLKGRKWDARMYLIIHGVNPMRGYVTFDTGFARVCTDEYERGNVTNPHATITNGLRNIDHPNYVSEPENEEDEDQVYHRYPLTRAWELVSENLDDPEADLEKMKQGVKDLANSLLRCYRSSIEAEQADFMEMDGARDKNDKLFNILGLDVMFDADLRPWLFETNRNPGMSLTYPMLNEEGVVIQKNSKIATGVKCNLINEVAKILIGKEDSKSFAKIYDSSDLEGGDADFIYEKVFRLFKNLCGTKLTRTLSIHSFISYINQVAEDFTEDIHCDEVINRVELKSREELTLPEFFSGLEVLAETVSMSLPTFLTRIEAE